MARTEDEGASKAVCAAALLAAGLRHSRGDQHCGTCAHAAVKPGAQLVRCRKFDQLVRRGLLCDLWAGGVRNA